MADTKAKALSVIAYYDRVLSEQGHLPWDEAGRYLVLTKDDYQIIRAVVVAATPKQAPVKLSDWTPEMRERLALWLTTKDKLSERTTPEIVNMLLENLPMAGAYGALVEEACTRLQPDWMDEKYDTTPPTTPKGGKP